MPKKGKRALTGEFGVLRDRLREAVDKGGGNRAVAKAADVSLSTLNKWLAGAEPGALNLKKIADLTGTSLDYLVGRDDSKSGTLMVRSELEGETFAEVVLVPRLEVRASAGPGRAVIDAEEGRSIAFQRAWLRQLGITPTNAEFLMADGDSMEPTIKHGDLMLVDRGFGQVQDGKIYVFVRDGLVSVKRVQQLALGGLVLISDNDRYPDQIVASREIGELNIEGRVAWYGRAM